MTASHRYALPSGHRLGEYRIDHYLGSGGFGITYLATDENLNLQVAIKEYLPSDLAMRDADDSVVVKTAEDKVDFEWGRDRFLDEARSLARFNHPNIVRVQRFFEAHGTSYIVMDYVEGEPLSDLLERKSTLTETEIHQLVLPLADGLADMHEASLLHRDIKPSNIIIRDDGTPVLIDFGSARQAVGLKSRSMTSVVTPGYAPLEQYAGKSRQGPATDIYAIGAVLYRCVTGKVPDDATERAIEDALAPATQAAVGDYCADLLVAIDEAMALRMEDRPKSIAMFLSALGGIRHQTNNVRNREFGASSNDAAGVSSVEPRPKKGIGKSGPLLYALVFVAFAALAVLAVFHNLQPFDSTPWAQNSSGEKAAESKGTSELATTPRSPEVQEGLRIATRALAHQDYATALTVLRRLAERGEPSAQCHLGDMYEVGMGLTQDSAQAAAWFRKAAEQGVVYAQHRLGQWYLDGRGVPQDDAQAAAWWRKAAEQGHTSAQYNLGAFYRLGRGVPQDDAQAAAWYRKAAERGDAHAKYQLGLMHKNGSGVSQDYVEAYAWFRAAAEILEYYENKSQTEISSLLPYMTMDQILAGEALGTKYSRGDKPEGGHHRFCPW